MIWGHQHIVGVVEALNMNGIIEGRCVSSLDETRL